MVRQWQHSFYNDNYSQTTLNRQTDFVALAKSFGAKGRRAESLEELKDILTNDFNESGPMLIDCRIDMDEKVIPLIPAGKSVEDMIIE